MYSVWSVSAGLAVAVAFVWLGILTYSIWQQRNFLQSLFPRHKEREIRKKFEELLEEVKNFKGDLKGIDLDLDNLKKEGLLHISRFKLLRYNPYEDTGGDQSFSIALLDERGSGIVLTSLHARSGTRVFAKPVIEG